jgi:hypothetical protein
MHEPARPVDLVPDRLRLAHRDPGGLIDVRQARHSIAGQHTTDRGAVQMQVIRDPVRPPPAGEPQRHDPVLRAARQAIR